MDAGRAYDPATGLLPPLLALENENLAEVRRGLQVPRPDLKALQESIARRTAERVRELLESRGLPAAE